MMGKRWWLAVILLGEINSWFQLPFPVGCKITLHLSFVLLTEIFNHLKRLQKSIIYLRPASYRDSSDGWSGVTHSCVASVQCTAISPQTHTGTKGQANYFNCVWLQSSTKNKKNNKTDKCVFEINTDLVKNDVPLRNHWRHFFCNCSITWVMLSNLGSKRHFLWLCGWVIGSSW